MSEHYCRACKRDIKSLGWATHLSGKKHKENMKALRERELILPSETEEDSQ